MLSRYRRYVFYYSIINSCIVIMHYSFVINLAFDTFVMKFSATY